MKRIATTALVILATLALLFLLWQLRQVVVLFLLSMATASAFRPLIDGLKNRGASRAVALLAAYLSVFVVIGGLVFLVSRPLVMDLQNASNQAAIFYDTIKSTWPAGDPMQRAIAQQLPTMSSLAAFALGSSASESLQTLAGFGSALLQFFGNLVLILILSLYWSADYLRFERLWLAMLAPETRPQARETFKAIESNLGAYIRSEVIQSLLAVILLWVGYQAMGMKFAVLMAVFGGLAWLIPWFGAVIAVLPPLMLGLAQGGPTLAILAVAYTLVVLFVQERVIEPRFFTRPAYSSVILVVLVLILASEFGLIGLIMAPLVSAAVQISLRYLLQPPGTVVIPARLEVEQVGQEIKRLEEQIEKVEQSLADEEVEPTQDLKSKLERIKKLTAEARSYIDSRTETIERTQTGSDRERMPLPE